MILTKVDIRDFKSYKSTTVKFDKGISVIIGENGSGKTSILESINFALFKQKPNASINMDDLIRRGAANAEVSVTFIANGRTFRATRGRKRGKAYGSVLYNVDNNKTLAKGEDEITKEIEGILGMGGELFTSAVYIKQGEIDRLISAQPSVRKEQIGKLLGTDELERAYQGMAELVKEYRRKSDRLSSIPGDIMKKEETIKEKKDGLILLKNELKSASLGILTLQKELETLQKTREDLERLKAFEDEKVKNEIRFKNLSENRERIEKYERELTETQGFYDRYKAIEKEMKGLTEERRKLSEILEKVAGLRRELSNADDTASRLKYSIDADFKKFGEILRTAPGDFESLINSHKKMLQSLKIDEERAKGRIEEASSKISRAQGKNREIENSVGKLNNAGITCPVCQGPLDEKHKKELLEEYSQKIEKNEGDIKKWEAVLIKLREDSKGITKSIETIGGINMGLLKSRINEAKEIRTHADKIKSGIAKNEAAIKDVSIERRLEGKEKELSGLERKNETYITAKNYLRRYLPEKEDIDAEAEKIEKRLLKLNVDIEKLGGAKELKNFERLKLKEKGAIEKLNYKRRAEAGLESRMEFENRELKKLNNRIEELKLKEKEREKLTKFLSFLEGIRQLFHRDVLQKELRTKAMPLIERYTTEIFDMFDLPYNDLELTSDFNIVLFGPHGEVGVDMLSGGEKIASALALRIGIAKALSGSAMELIILDEPTIHLDSQRKWDLVEIIKKLSQIPQTIIVTHDQEFEQAADRLIYVEKSNGISRVSS